MFITILISVGAIGLGVAIGLKKAKKEKELYNKGIIMRRDINYAEKGEEFTSKVGDLQRVKESLSSLNAGCEFKGSVQEVVFKGKPFAATLSLVSFDEATGTAVYRFNFTHFRESGYSYENGTGMNMLLTAVEKMFLSLDPDTSVKTFDVGFKKKRSVF